MKAAWRARREREVTMEAIIFIVVLVAFSLATWRWGFDSRDRFDSPEWERRRSWRSHRLHIGPR